jgi:DNA-binding MarR family transcriptional regulator
MHLNTSAEDQEPHARSVFSDVSQSAVSEVLFYIKEGRELRDRFLDPQLFGEPAWDMLLDLYEAALAQQRLSVSAVCVGSRVPATTALRWLKLMERKGLIYRTPDPMDARRIFVSLSHAALAAMDGLFIALEAQTATLHRWR